MICKAYFVYIKVHFTQIHRSISAQKHAMKNFPRILLIFAITFPMTMLDAFSLGGTAIITWWVGTVIYCARQPRPRIWDGMHFNLIYSLWWLLMMIRKNNVRAWEYGVLIGVFVIMQVTAIIASGIYLGFRKLSEKRG